jgi:hypothetical protein
MTCGLSASPPAVQSSPTLSHPAFKVWAKTPFTEAFEASTVWLTQDTLLYEILDTQTVQLRQHNVVTGEDTALEPLDAQLTKARCYPCGWYPLSPDGRKLLCVDAQENVVGYALDGTRLGSSTLGYYQVSPGASSYDQISWLADSRSWAELRVDPKAHRYTQVWVYSTDASKPVSKLPLSPTIPLSPQQMIETPSRYLVEGLLSAGRSTTVFRVEIPIPTWNH